MERLEFMELVTVNRNGCWIWKGSFRGGMYAQCRHKDEPTRMVSHLAFRLFKGRLKKGLRVCHTCDHPPCVNPSHLFAGTAKDNTQDMIKKGRLGKHPLGRPYNTTEARLVLASKHKDPAWVKLQKERQLAGFARRRDLTQLLRSGWGHPWRLLGLDKATRDMVEAY
jgi:hypothetical protein